MLFRLLSVALRLCRKYDRSTMLIRSNCHLFSFFPSIPHKYFVAHTLFAEMTMLNLIHAFFVHVARLFGVVTDPQEVFSAEKLQPEFSFLCGHLLAALASRIDAQVTRGA